MSIGLWSSMSNPGHIGGSRQLLVEGVRQIPIECAYTVLLEADTWLFSDLLVGSLLPPDGRAKLSSGRARIGRSGGIALRSTSPLSTPEFLRENSAQFDFVTHPECYICNYLMDHGREVHLYPGADAGPSLKSGPEVLPPVRPQVPEFPEVGHGHPPHRGAAKRH